MANPSTEPEPKYLLEPRPQPAGSARSAPAGKSYMGLVLGGLAVVYKSKALIVALKALKFTKPLVVVISMAISVVVYGLALGIWFGVGLVAMLFIHEMGHVIALRLKGYETPGPVFIPFLGALIFAPQFPDRDTEAFVGYGGPLLGTIGALACMALWFVADGRTAEILLLVSYTGILLNLFNLIPVSPLDGGRVTQSVGEWFKYVGLAVLLVYTLMSRQPGLILIWVLVLDSFRSRLWLRPVIATVLVVAMATLIALDFGYPRSLAGVETEFIIAAVLTALYWFRDIRRYKAGLVGRFSVADARAYPPVGIRAKWLTRYLWLVALTVLSLIWQTEHLPDAVKLHSERITSPS